MLVFDQTIVNNEKFTSRHLTDWVINWPIEFYVCEQCKFEFFLDYDDALVGDDTQCCLCNPCENDSLGG